VLTRVAQALTELSDVSITLNTYSHVLPCLRSEAVGKRGGMLFGDECQQRQRDG
jgi:hypothetical protein